DIDSGLNFNGYVFGQNAAPYYRVNTSNLGGISTAAGGDVTISAGENVISYLPTQNDYDASGAGYDGGTGACRAQPGNVSIHADGSVFGHYVVANGIGTITAGADVGMSLLGAQSKGFALSLIKGSWSVYAPNGSIYVQDVRNPNGIFNDKTLTGYEGSNVFDYDPQASVFFQAGHSVEFTGAGAPHKPASAPGEFIPFLFPPSLEVVSGSGGFILDIPVTLFPSSSGNLDITTLN